MSDVKYTDNTFIDIIVISGHFLHNHSTFSN